MPVCAALTAGGAKLHIVALIAQRIARQYNNQRMLLLSAK
jgi:hypothetical protein